MSRKLDLIIAENHSKGVMEGMKIACSSLTGMFDALADKGIEHLTIEDAASLVEQFRMRCSLSIDTADVAERAVAAYEAEQRGEA